MWALPTHILPGKEGTCPLSAPDFRAGCRWIRALVLLVTLPFGFYRAYTRKLSLRWFLRSIYRYR